jgi:two-component system LytT family sensor kinase
MKKLLTYENFWTRNIIFASGVFGLIYLRTKIFELPSHRPKIPDTIQLFGLFMVGYCIVLAYNHFIVQKLLFAKRYTAYGVATVLVLLAYAFILTILNGILDTPSSFIGELFPGFVFLFVGTAVIFIHTWILQNVVKAKKDLLHKEAEIAFLKQQISPHFLFNALNNLYGVALAYPTIVADKILELSDLLRYQVESTNRDSVSIEEEMNFIENYINYTSFKSKDLQITNVIDNAIGRFTLPPLLFLPLIENAVKYSSETENSFINIHWAIDGAVLKFSIDNSYNPENSRVKGTKVGMDNLRKRLNILNINYELNINTDTVGVYKIQLLLWEISTNA